MSRLKQLQERHKKISRVQIMKSIFSSVIMTTAVIVAAVILIPKSPKADILKIDAFTNSIAYTINITDSDNAIIPGTLLIQLENQFDTYQEEVNLGKNVGMFQDLTDETQYTLKILADKGFGQEVLDSEKIITAPKTGGAIIGINLLSEDLAYELDYGITYFISDPFLEFKSVQLRYAYKSLYEEDFTNYQTILLDITNFEQIIQYIYNSNLEVNVILEAINQSDEIVELDNQIFYTPFLINGSMDIHHITNNSVSLYVWPEGQLDVSPEYEVILKLNGMIVDRKTLEVGDPDQTQHDSGIMTFTELRANKDYTVTLNAKYINPYTKERIEQEITILEFRTTPNFNYQITVEEFTDYYQINIELDDPEDFYDFAYFNIYDLTDGYDWIIESNSFDYQSFDEKKQFSFTIDKPSVTVFKIEIGIQDDTSYYNYIVLKNIESN